MDVFKKSLVSFIQGIIKEKKNIQISHEESEKLIKNPPDSSFGDYSLASYYLSRYGFKGKPEEIAEEIFNIFIPDFERIEDLFDKIEIKGVYINFFVDKEKFASHIIQDVAGSNGNYGRTAHEKPLKVIIDFSSPNIAKPFGVGHLRSTVIGMSLSKIYEFCGHNVIKINYLGDFGTQFGKLITAFCRYNDINFSEFEKDPVKVLYGLYVRIHKDEQTDATANEEAKNRFKMLEDFISINKRSLEEYLGNLNFKKTKKFFGGENSAEGISDEIKLSEKNKNAFCGTQEGQYDLWRLFRKLSINEFKRIYKSIGIEFDAYEGEASSAEFSNDIKDILLESGIAEVSEGAVIVRIKGVKAPALIAKSDGTSLYLSRDIVTAISRMAKYNFDKMIYVVGSEQSLHFNQLFGIFDMLKENLKENIDKLKDSPNFKRYVSIMGGRLVHVKFGRIIGMSTRKGNIVFLNDYIEEASLKAKEKLNKERLERFKDGGTVAGEVTDLIKTTSKITPVGEKSEAEQTSLKIGIGAVIFNDLKTRRATDVNFNWDNVLSFEGQTGPYLQYTVSRINSLVSKLNALNIDSKHPDFSFSKKDTDFNDIFLIAKQIACFKDAVNEAMEQNEPSVLSSYALELASLFNKYYQNYRLIGNDINFIKPRLFMLSSVRTVLTQILNLLCVPVLERM